MRSISVPQIETSISTMIVVQLARPNPHFIKESCTVCEIPREDWKDSSTLSPKRETISGLACVAYAESFCHEWRFLINQRLLFPLYQKR